VDRSTNLYLSQRRFCQSPILTRAQLEELVLYGMPPRLLMALSGDADRGERSKEILTCGRRSSIESCRSTEEVLGAASVRYI